MKILLQNKGYRHKTNNKTDDIYSQPPQIHAKPKIFLLTDKNYSS